MTWCGTSGKLISVKRFAPVRRTKAKANNMSNTFKAAQRAYDMMEPSWEPYDTDEQPDPRDEFIVGFGMATGISRSEAYYAWLTWLNGERSQIWVDAQEEGGWLSGFEHGLHWCIDTQTPRAGWAQATEDLMKNITVNVREIMELEVARLLNPNAGTTQAFPKGRWA